MEACDLPLIHHSFGNVSTTKAQTAIFTKKTYFAVQLDTHEHCMNTDLILSYVNNVGLAV